MVTDHSGLGVFPYVCVKYYSIALLQFYAYMYLQPKLF